MDGAKNLKMTYEEAVILHTVGTITKNDEEIKKALDMYPELQFRTTLLNTLQLSNELKEE